MESCGRYIVLVMTFEVATHFLKCISCSITPQTPVMAYQCEKLLRCLDIQVTLH